MQALGAWIGAKQLADSIQQLIGRPAQHELGLNEAESIHLRSIER